MEDILRSKGYTIMILCTHKQLDVERQMLLYTVSHGVDGIILAPISNNPDSAEFFTTLQVPIILVDREVPGRKTDLVCMDDYMGGQLAGKILVRAGHRSILYISGPLSNNSEILRRKGLTDVLEEQLPGRYSFRRIEGKSTDLMTVQKNCRREPRQHFSPFPVMSQLQLTSDTHLQHPPEASPAWRIPVYLAMHSSVVTRLPFVRLCMSDTPDIRANVFSSCVVRIR